MIKTLKSLTWVPVIFSLCLSTASHAKSTHDWQVSLKKNMRELSQAKDLPKKRLFDLDLSSMKTKLHSAPKRFSGASAKKTPVFTSATIIELPRSSGKTEQFRVYEDSVMAPELSAKYPEIKSYFAVGIEDPSARAYLSNSPLGFKSMVLASDKSAEFIEPVSDDLSTYTVYKKSERKDSEKFECTTKNDEKHTSLNDRLQKILNEMLMIREANAETVIGGANDGILRTFRLALSCTAEYAAYFGGTKALALAGMTNTLTRMNGVFEKDFGVRLVLIANNDALVYTDATSDPYSDYAYKTNWKTENQAMLTSVIGEANYDIGHLLGAGSVNSGDGGTRGSVCTDSAKGRAYTTANPSSFQGDRFDISYVAHEIGHQLGAQHTFTYVNESTIAQLEPGSGSTIMSYAGVTVKDIQAYSDAYFHAISIQQVTDIIKNKSCPVRTSGNSVPVVSAGMDYIIPKSTPFMLTGSASDANVGDVLTYSWEEMDLGNATTTVPSPTASTGPLFRSYLPSASPARYFPNVASILAGLTTTQGRYILSEALPGVARTLNFRLTVRDNHLGGGANKADDMVVTVDGNSGPFTVESLNATASYVAGTTLAIDWSVAGTNAGAINCTTVDIFLSTDGGKTWPITLAAATPNDGSASVVMPNIPGTRNRIMVKGTGQIFFDVNNADFAISGSVSSDTTAPSASTLSASGTTTVSTNLTWTAATDSVGVVGYDVYQNGVMKTSVSGTTLVVSGLSASTFYSFYVKAKDAAGNRSSASNTVSVTTLAVVVPTDTTAPSAPALTASGATSSSTNLYWSGATDAVGVTGYDIYQNGVLRNSSAGTNASITGLSSSTIYSFYVIAKDAAGNRSLASNGVSVTTLAPAPSPTPSPTPTIVPVSTVSVSLTVPAAVTRRSTTTFSATASSTGMTINRVEFYVAGALVCIDTTAAYSCSWKAPNAAKTVSVEARAYDSSGAQKSAFQTMQVTR